MAVLFNAEDDDLASTASLPSSTSFTICGWGYRIAGVGYASMAILESAGEAEYLFFGFNGTNISLLSNGTTTSFDESAFPSNPAANTWFFWAMTCVGTGGADQVGYWALPNDASFTTVNNSGASMTENTLMIGNSIGNDEFGGRLAAVKVWDAVLTSAELQNERHTFTPHRFANLNRWSDFIFTGGTSFLDRGPNGRDWTETGTVDDADGPPIAWDFTGPIIVPAPAAAVDISHVAALADSFDNVVQRRRTKITSF